MAYRIIDTIEHRHSWTFRYPDLQQKYGQGVQVILDPLQISEQPDIAGRRVQLLRPDGSVGEFEVSVVDINPGGVVSLFFRGADKRDIPIGSEVLW